MARNGAVLRVKLGSLPETFQSRDLLKTLSNPAAKQYAIVAAAPPVFCKLLQYVLDILFDATRQTGNGVAWFTALSLHYWCVDELLVAFHLDLDLRFLSVGNRGA